MSAFFLLNNDLSVYYTLIMYLACVIIGIPFFMPGYIFLALMIGLYALRISYLEDRDNLNILNALVPAFAFLFHPSPVQAAMIVPVWVWLVIRMFRKDYDLSYGDFRRLAGRILLAEFLLLIALFFLPGWAGAVLSAIPYFAIQLAFMVCSLRYLRQERAGGLSSLAVTGSVMAFSVLTSLTGFFDKAYALITEVYLYLVSKLFSVVLPEQVPQIDEIELPDAMMIDTGGEPLPSEAAPVESVIAQLKEMSLFEKILIVSVIAGIVLAVILFLLHFMKGHRYYKRKKNEDITEVIEGRKKNRMPLFAPSDHREAVRWYYGRYIKECRRRGVLITPVMTSEQIAEADDLLDEKERADFRDLYIRCRYSSNEVSSEDVKKAKAYYRMAKSAERG